MARKGDITTAIEALEVGEKVVFPLERISSVQALASMLGLRLGRRHSTVSDRENRTITVTRDF